VTVQWPLAILTEVAGWCEVLFKSIGKSLHFEDREGRDVRNVGKTANIYTVTYISKEPPLKPDILNAFSLEIAMT